jgi:hypothetical protein
MYRTLGASKKRSGRGGENKTLASPTHCTDCGIWIVLLLCLYTGARFHRLSVNTDCLSRLNVSVGPNYAFRLNACSMSSIASFHFPSD